MVVKEIYVSVGVTINAGPYQSAKSEQGVVVSLEPGERESEIRKSASAYLMREAKTAAEKAAAEIK